VFTPWNETCPIKCRSSGMLVIQLWQNPCNPSYSIPLGPAPWNEICAVSHPHRGIVNIPPEGSLAQQDGTIPLGIHHSLSRFTVKLHQPRRTMELFLLCPPREMLALWNFPTRREPLWGFNRAGRFHRGVVWGKE